MSCEMPGSKGHESNACIRIHDFGTRKNMRKQPFSKKMSEFRMFLGLREHEVRSNPWHRSAVKQSI